MIAALIIFLSGASAATGRSATAPPDGATVFAKLKTAGLTMEEGKCKPTAFAEGEGRHLSFIETAFDCGDFTVQMEISYPMPPAAMSQEVDAEVAKVRGVYGAQKNPYTGYVSQTAACPQNENLWQEKFQSRPFLIGRLNERGAWGACGKNKEDLWGAITFVESKSLFAKVRILGKKRLVKSRFSSDALGFLHSVRIPR